MSKVKNQLESHILIKKIVKHSWHLYAINLERQN